MSYSILIHTLGQTAPDTPAIQYVDRNSISTGRLKYNLMHYWAWADVINADGPCVAVEFNNEPESERGDFLPPATMTCVVNYGYINMFGSFVGGRDKTLICDNIPYSRQRARQRARDYTKQSKKYAAEVSTVVNGKHINIDLWIGGYQVS